MSDIHQDIEPHAVAFGQIYQGIAKSSPSRLQGGIDVMIPDINPDIEFQNVRPHVTEDDFRPRVGDEVLVIFDNNNQPWIISWAPGIPVGGTAQQVLFKNTATDYDASWRKIAQGDLPINLQGQELQPVAGNDANQALATGWYRLDTGATNGPDTSRYWHLFVQNMFGNQIRQTAYAIVSDDLRVRRNDSGVWGSWYLPTPKVTTSLFSSGPPASPSDGDIWYATNVLSNNGGEYVRWQFQYSSTDAVWRWVGGPPSVQTGGSFANGLNCDAGWHEFPTRLQWTVPRTGLYQVGSQLAVVCNVPTQYVAVGFGINGSISTNLAQQHLTQSGGYYNVTSLPQPANFTAGQVVSLQYNMNGGGSTSSFVEFLNIIPQRIS